VHVECVLSVILVFVINLCFASECKALFLQCDRECIMYSRHVAWDQNKHWQNRRKRENQWA